MNKQELIDTLKSQHRQLRADLTKAINEAKEGVVKNETEILFFLAKFKEDLKVHITLENEVFYPDYLAIKLKRGEDLAQTSQFVDEMKKIGYGVNEFLDKYDTPEELEDIKRDFVKDLSEIIKVLEIRISTEEDSVFDIYLLMKD
ncbi:MAG: hemerythrin domain-containing protein [bacterium]